MFPAGLKPSGADADLGWRFIRGKDVDITLAQSELTTLENADIFLVDEGASALQSKTKKITASNMKTYFQTGVLLLSGGTITGDTTLTNDTKIIFGDAGEYIKGDGTDLTIESSGKINLKVASELVVEDDGGTGQPVITIKQPAGNYGSSGQLVFNTTRGASTAGQDNDDLGVILFKGHNDAGTPEDTSYVRILAEIHDATDGQESGKLSLGVTTHDGDTSNYGLVLTGGSVADEIDVTIGNGDDSLTIIKGRLAFGDSATDVNIILDEDNMVSNNADALVTQQSVKAYVDSHQKFSESIEFFFDKEVTSRTYFRDADDSNYPFKWDTYDTEDSINVGDTISITSSNATGGIIVPYDCKLKGVRWVGYNGMNYDQVVDLQVWTGTVGNNSSNLVTATLRDSRRVTNHNRKSFNIGQALDVSLSAGDSVIPAFLYTSGTAVYFSGKVVFLFERA
jgi:hypothetical protein